MCIEDVRLGREIAVQEQSIRLTTANKIVIDASPNRVTLIIYPPLSGTLTLSLTPVAIAGKGVVLVPASSPLHFDIRKHGNLVCQAWHGIHSVGGVNMVYQEGLLERQ